jgi:glycosyltransferase involved in cell wall biosynthesis
MWSHLVAAACPVVDLPLSRFERQVRATLERLNPDCVHAQFGSIAAWIHRACTDLEIPLIITFRGKDASAKLRKSYWRQTYHELARNASAVTAVSEDLAAYLQPVLPEGTECQVIYSGIDLEAIPFREPLEPRGRLISVGRLVSKKGHDDAIRALAEVRGSGIEAHLTIIGECQEESTSALRRLISELRLEPHVDILGALPHEQVLKAYQEADLLIAANRTGEDGDREGVPNVVKEAQLSGLPVVATRHGGIPSAIPAEFRDELVEEADYEAMAHRIKEMLGQNRNQLAARAARQREHVQAHFSIEAEIRAYQRLYERSCAGSPQS